MNEYIKSEVEQLMEIQPFVSEHISEEAVTMIQTENDRENNNMKTKTILSKLNYIVLLYVYVLLYSIFVLSLWHVLFRLGHCE